MNELQAAIDLETVVKHLVATLTGMQSATATTTKFYGVEKRKTLKRLKDAFAKVQAASGQGPLKRKTDPAVSKWRKDNMTLFQVRRKAEKALEDAKAGKPSKSGKVQSVADAEAALATARKKYDDWKGKNPAPKSQVEASK